MRKSEDNLYQTKVATLPCLVPHNICLDRGNTIIAKFVKIDPVNNQKRDGDTIRDFLLMKSRNHTIDKRGN